MLLGGANAQVDWTPRCQQGGYVETSARFFLGWVGSSSRHLFCPGAFFLLATFLEGEEVCGVSFWDVGLLPGADDAPGASLASSS